MCVCEVCGGGGGYLQGYGTHYEMQGKNILGLPRTYYGMSRGRAKDRVRAGIKVVWERSNGAGGKREKVLKASWL